MGLKIIARIQGALGRSRLRGGRRRRPRCLLWKRAFAGKSFSNILLKIFGKSHGFFLLKCRF